MLPRVRDRSNWLQGLLERFTVFEGWQVKYISKRLPQVRKGCSDAQVDCFDTPVPDQKWYVFTSVVRALPGWISTVVRSQHQEIVV